MKILSILISLMLVFCLVMPAAGSVLYEADSNLYGAENNYGPPLRESGPAPTAWGKGVEGRSISGLQAFSSGVGEYVMPRVVDGSPCDCEEEVVVVDPLTFVVYFDFDKSDIRADQVAVLQDALDYAKQGEVPTIELSAYCDFRGSDDYNVDLGNRRADAVRAWFGENNLDTTYIVENNGKFKSLIHALANKFCKTCWNDRRVEITVK